MEAKKIKSYNSSITHLAYHFCVPNPIKPAQPPLSPSLLTPHQQQDTSLFTFDTSLSFPLLVISHFRFLNDIWVS
ncbi:hypothetical protein Peur_063635 [Populus x canadensis]